MADTFDTATRRRIMQRVRRANTAPEQALATWLEAQRIPFYRQAADLAGRPDFVLPQLGIVIFVNGCFWHGHQACSKGRRCPGTNADYWQQKIERNRRRDRRVAGRLRRQGYSVYTVWGCELNKGDVPARLTQRLRRERQVSVRSDEQDRIARLR